MDDWQQSQYFAGNCNKNKLTLVFLKLNSPPVTDLLCSYFSPCQLGGCPKIEFLYKRSFVFQKKFKFPDGLFLKMPPVSII